MKPTKPTTYRARLRFRLLKKLDIETPKHRMVVADREVVLSAMQPDCSIRDSDWLVMNVLGFDSPEAATQFGHDLRAAIDLSSVSTRLGVDLGRDIPTSVLFQPAKDNILKQTGCILRDNVHGLDVFEDDPRVQIFSISATVAIHAKSDPFLALVAELHEEASTISEEARDVVLLLNYALMRTEPVAQIIFSFSAVEMLGQREVWSPTQKILLAEIVRAAKSSNIGDSDERDEVAGAIEKSLHRLSLRQGVLRLLDRLHLSHLKKSWDVLYAERSTLVHGLAPRPGVDYSDLAARSVNLCGHILLKTVAAELPIAERHLNTYYSVEAPAAV